MKSKKTKKVVTTGIAHIYSSFNNTIITITDNNGNTLAWDSGGKQNFKGSRKATPYAAQMAAENLAKVVTEYYGIKALEIYLRGPGAGKESAVQALRAAGIIITLIRDITSIAFNGTRPPKRRRV